MARLHHRYPTTEEYLRSRETGDHELQARYLTTMRLRSGVFKSTNAHRMDDAADLVVRHIAGRSTGALRVLDVACSSGVSTVELHEKLQRAGFACETFGTDIVTDVSLIEDANGLGVLFDSSANVLRVEWRGTSLPWPPVRSDMLFRPLHVAKTAFRLRTALRGLRRALHGDTVGYRVTLVPLTTAAADGLSGVSLVQESIDEPRIVGPFDIVRAANILNHGYFDQAVLRRMMRAIVGRVADGGLLLVLRTGMDFVNRGTLFRCGREITVLERLNGGSEVESLVMPARS
jgi:SAM-dependent methyltransferase